MSVQVPAGNIADAFSIWAQRTPWAPAVIDGPDIVSYRALEALMLRIADRFSEGAVIGVVLAQTPAALHLAATLALARIGAIHLLLSPDEVASGEAVQLLRRHRARAILTDMALPDDLGIPAIAPDSLLLEPAASAPEQVPKAAGGAMPWLLARSSGTTGKPKEFYFTHAMDHARHRTRPEQVKLPPGERTMTLVDFGFTMGLRLRCLWDGAVLVARPKKARANDIFEAADRHGVSSMICTPSFLAFLLKGSTGDTPRLPLLRCLAITGAAVTQALYVQASRRLSPNLLIIYGSNETWNIAAATADLMARQPRTVGHLTEAVELEIVDAQDHPVEPGATGEVRVRTPGMITGYLDPEANARHFRDGWFYPGDAGFRTADGLLFLKGRTDEIMNLDGMLVSPEEIENAALQYAGIAEAAAFGVPSPSRGDQPFLAVVSGSPVDIDKLLAHCRARLGRRAPLAVIQVQSLPRSPIGKVLRRNLTQAALKHMKNATPA